MADGKRVNQLRARKIYHQRRSVAVHEYKRMYKFTEDGVRFLAQQFLGAETGETRGGALTNVQKMETFLRSDPDPGFQMGIGEDHGIKQPSVSRTVWFVAQAITAQKGFTAPADTALAADVGLPAPTARRMRQRRKPARYRESL